MMWWQGAEPTFTAAVANYAPGLEFGPRTLVDWELVWIIAGSARWTFLSPTGRRTQLTLREGDVLLAEPGGVDHYEWYGPAQSVHGYAHFTLTGSAPPQLPLVRHGNAGSLLTVLCSHLIELSSRADESADEARLTLGLALAAFAAGETPAADHGIAPPVAAVLRHLRARWAGGILHSPDAGELARVAAVTAPHLMRIFADEYGTGLITGLELVRLAHAAIELQRSNRTLDAIARDNGFADASHFSRRFSKAYGAPPGRFRRAVNGQDALAPITKARLLPLWNAIFTFRA